MPPVAPERPPDPGVTTAPPSAPAPQPSPTLALTGIVYGDGLPLAGANVEVRRKIGADPVGKRFGSTVSTDASGRYRLEVPTTTPMTIWITGYHRNHAYQPCAAWFERAGPEAAETMTQDVRLSAPASLLTATGGVSSPGRTVAGTIYRVTPAGNVPVPGAGVAWDGWTEISAGDGNVNIEVILK